MISIGKISVYMESKINKHTNYTIQTFSLDCKPTLDLARTGKFSVMNAMHLCKSVVS